MSQQFPKWIRRPWGSGAAYQATKGLLDDLRLNTVCRSARCPNQGECWSHRTATFLVLGTRCTRNCAFCAVESGAPSPVDTGEPERIAEAARRLQLRHVVITSVTRDDLPDGGAGHFAATVCAIRRMAPSATTEVLVPDFGGDLAFVDTVLAAAPTVFGHNIETVETLYAGIRDARAAYRRSLAVLCRAAKAPGRAIVKSGLMVGHGETADDIRQTLADLRDAGCRVVTIGQYLQPTRGQRPVVEFVKPERFAEYEQWARAMGFDFVVAGPFVRSSYQSEAAVNALVSERVRHHMEDRDACMK